MDGLVQFACEAKLDARTGDDWSDLADSLPNHLCDLWVRFRTGDPAESALARGIAIRYESCGEPCLHAHPIWAKKLAARCRGHSGRVVHDHLDDGSDLETLSLGHSSAGAILGLGVAGDRPATEHHGHELVTTFRESRMRSVIDIARALMLP